MARACSRSRLAIRRLISTSVDRETLAFRLDLNPDQCVNRIAKSTRATLGSRELSFLIQLDWQTRREGEREENRLGKESNQNALLSLDIVLDKSYGVERKSVRFLRGYFLVRVVIRRAAKKRNENKEKTRVDSSKIHYRSSILKQTGEGKKIRQ